LGSLRRVCVVERIGQANLNPTGDRTRFGDEVDDPGGREDHREVIGSISETDL
jgi:hypothetical protein